MRNWRKVGPAARPTWKLLLAIFRRGNAIGERRHPGSDTGRGLAQRSVVPFHHTDDPRCRLFHPLEFGATPQALVGASSSACGSLMLHQSVTKNGVEQMIMVPKVAVPAHGTLQFAPGGYHLMCMSPAATMRPGQSVPVTLQFEGGGTLSASFPVRGATGK